MEPCSGGELYAKVISRGKLSEKDIVSVTRQILEVIFIIFGKKKTLLSNFYV